MKRRSLCAAGIAASLLLAGCAAQSSLRDDPVAGSAASTAVQQSLPPDKSEPEQTSWPQEQQGDTQDIPVYQMEYELPYIEQGTYQYGERLFTLAKTPQTDAAAAVVLYWQSEQSGEFARHSYLWAEGMDDHWQVMIDNAYSTRESVKDSGFARIEVEALQELTREEMLTSENTAYEEPLLQRYYERFGTGEEYTDYVKALYNSGVRVVYLRLDTEYFHQNGSQQYPDGEREMCYLTGPDNAGQTVLYADSYGYSTLIPNPDAAPPPVASGAP